MSRRLKLFTLVLGLTMVVGVPAALAAKGGNGNGGGGDVTGTIEMMQPVAAATAEASPWPAYGDSVGFDARVNGSIANNATVFITVVCWQGDEVVYQRSNTVDSSFTLDSGVNLQWDGEPAVCTASLRYKVKKGKNIQYSVLDAVTFDTY